MHVEHETDGEEVVAEEPLVPEEIRPGDERPERRDLVRGRVEAGVGTTEHGERGVRLHVRDTGQPPLDAVDPRHHRRGQRIVGFRQQERELARAKDLLERACGDVVRILRDDEPVDRVVLTDLSGEPDARREQNGPDGEHEPAPRDQNGETAGEPARWRRRHPCVHFGHERRGVSRGRAQSNVCSTIGDRMKRPQQGTAVFTGINYPF